MQSIEARVRFPRPPRAPRAARSLAAALALAGLLAGCGGDGATPANGSNGDTGATTPPAPATRRVLLVGIDGLSYPDLQAALAQQQLPALAQLGTAAAHAAGVSGTVTQQPALAGPGWATVLTGTWANRHGVTTDAGSQPLQADTLFARLKRAGAGGKIAVAAAWSPLVRQLGGQPGAAQVERLIDCAGVDACVTDATLRAVAERDYGVVVANFHAPADAAGGAAGDHRRALQAVDKQLGQLLSALQARAKADPAESWLVLTTSSRPLRPKDSADDAAAAAQSSFIALSRPGNAVFAAAVQAGQPASQLELYTRPSTADVAPTVLAYLGVPAATPAQYDIEGQSLLGAPGVQQLRASAGRDAGSIRLGWKLAPGVPAPAALTVYRDGKHIATLLGDATEYIDTGLGLADKEEGSYRFDYVVTADTVPLAYRAAISYVPPIVLPPTLLDRLMHYFSFDAGLGDARSAAVLHPLKAGAPAPKFADDGFGGKALLIDPRATSYDLADDLTTQAQFSLGFWYKSDGTQAWMPVLTNKDWSSGRNRGFIVGQSDAPGVMTFNFGDGSGRADASLAFTADQWVYVALSVDTVAKKATAYLADPVLGIRSAALNLAALDMSALRAPRLVLNEDATGRAYASYTSPAPVVPQYNDLALWGRVIDAKEVKALFASGQSLATLKP